MEICGDNRFEIIAKAKAHLLEATNIDTSEDEMKVLDTFLFRCWQMGWLDRYDGKDEPQTCDTCKWGEWYRKGYDITMMSDECGGCCSWNNKWTPKDEPQTDCSWK